MAFQKVEEQTNFIKLEKEKDELIGVLVEENKSSTYPDTNIYTIKLESAKVNGKLLDITAERFPEKVARYFGSTVLDQRMATVQPNSKIKIVYLGQTIKTQKGKAKNYEVFVDDGKN